VNGISDLLVGVAEEKKVDCEALLGGERILAGVNFVNFGRRGRSVSGCEIGSCGVGHDFTLSFAIRER
jgi:hypothetical protein